MRPEIEKTGKKLGIPKNGWGNKLALFGIIFTVAHKGPMKPVVLVSLFGWFMGTEIRQKSSHFSSKSLKTHC